MCNGNQHDIKRTTFFSFWKNPFLFFHERRIKKWASFLTNYAPSQSLDAFETQTVIPSFKRDLKSLYLGWNEVTTQVENEGQHIEIKNGLQEFVANIDYIQNEYITINNLAELENYLGKILEKVDQSKITIAEWFRYQMISFQEPFVFTIMHE